MSEGKVTYTKAPKEISESFERAVIIPDFLPPPEQLVRREPKTKITIALSNRSVDFFKKHAKENNTKYQVMINEVLDRYVEKHEALV